MSGGHKKEKSQNRPLNAAERADIFNSQVGLFSTALFGPQEQASGGYASTAPVYGSGYEDYGAQAGGRDFVSGTGGGHVNTRYAGRAERELFGTPVSPGDGMGSANPMQAAATFNAPTYESPGFAEAGNARTLSNEDYGRLEQSILNSRLAPVDRMMTLDRERVDQDLADRGIYSSGVGARAQNDLTERYLPVYAQAGGEAATQRYGMQAQEQQFLNQLAQSDAAQRNAFNLEQASRNYESNWAPLQYLAQLYGATGGQVGATNSYSQDFGF